MSAPIAKVSGVCQVGGIELGLNINRSGEGQEGWVIPMPAGVAGELTTRGGDAAGTITMPDALHGIVSEDIVAVFWTDANGLPCVMYGFEATVDEDKIAIALGAGDYEGEFPASTVLPAAETAVVICKKTERNLSVEADDATFIAAGSNYPAVGIFGAAAEIYPVNNPVGYSPAMWDAAGGGPTPLTDDPTKIVCYNGGTVVANYSVGVLLKQPAA